MNLSAAEIFSFSDSLIYFIKDLYDELLETGINVDEWLTELEKKKLIAEYVNREQEKMKAVKGELACKVQNALAELYGLSSEKLNALIFTLSKKDGLDEKKLRSVDCPGKR